MGEQPVKPDGDAVAGHGVEHHGQHQILQMHPVAPQQRHRHPQRHPRAAHQQPRHRRPGATGPPRSPPPPTNRRHGGIGGVSGASTTTNSHDRPRAPWGGRSRTQRRRWRWTRRHHHNKGRVTTHGRAPTPPARRGHKTPESPKRPALVRLRRRQLEGYCSRPWRARTFDLAPARRSVDSTNTGAGSTPPKVTASTC